MTSVIRLIQDIAANITLLPLTAARRLRAGRSAVTGIDGSIRRILGAVETAKDLSHTGGDLYAELKVIG